MKPRRVKFIRDLVVEEVMAVSIVEYATYKPMPPVMFDSDTVALDLVEERRVVPINQICGPNQPDLYIAYSQEVEELLKVPIACITRQCEELEEQLSHTRDILSCTQAYVRRLKGSFWLRLRFLFDRRM